MAAGDNEQLRVSREVLAAMRRAVTYAIEGETEFVSPPHLLLALLDDEKIGEPLAEVLSRDDLLEAATKKTLPGVLEIPEGELPEGEEPAFQRYDSLAFKAPDGSRSMYLDSDVYKVFYESARRAGDGPFLPRHLALGYVICSQKSGDLIAHLGRRPQDVTKAVYELQP